MDDNEFRDLQERSALIAEMAAHPGWTMLVDRAHATLAAKQQRILNGQLGDYTEYQKQCAYVDGALDVLHLPNRVAKELEEEMAFRDEIRKAEEEEEAA